VLAFGQSKELTPSSAGSGSSGGDGGDGGTVEVQVPEAMTHLLFAVEWDTRGGKGGVEGQHGNPGNGGLGGQGGDSCEWFEIDYHNFSDITKLKAGKNTSDIILLVHQNASE
jgi:hypothetical protein